MGDVFFEFAIPALQTLHVASAQKPPVFDVARLAAAATNVSFGLELWIKSLQLLRGIQPPACHDLGRLYEALPQDVRSRIESAYDALQSRHAGVKLAITHRPSDGSRPALPQPDTAVAFTDVSLPAVLRRAGDAFVTWRYLHERGGIRDYDFFTLEYEDLLNAAHCVGQEINSHLPDWRHVHGIG